VRGLKLLIIVLLLFNTSFLFSKTVDNRAVSKTISKKDLSSPCASKFLEIHMMAESDEQAGTAIMKLFWLVDSAFIKEVADSGVDGRKWGREFAESFRDYCEAQPPVNVRTAVRQTIKAMKNGNR
jgi:hypothetical protein